MNIRKHFSFNFTDTVHNCIGVIDRCLIKVSSNTNTNENQTGAKCLNANYANKSFFDIMWKNIRREIKYF